MARNQTPFFDVRVRKAVTRRGKFDLRLVKRHRNYTIEEAAKILGICRTVAYRKGVLPTVRIAGRLLVPKRALERLLAIDRSADLAPQSAGQRPQDEGPSHA